MTTADAFLKDVATHQMYIQRDDGVYRHIRFKKPNSSSFSFNLVTYPGYLIFTGDMGCYVFSRLDDMFEFFRSDTGRINPQYWGEKLKAVDCSGTNKGSAVEFSQARFTEVIKEYRLGWIKDAISNRSLTKEERRELWEAVDEEVLDYVDDDESANFYRANEFNWSKGRFLPGTYPSYQFTDFWDHRFTDYTFHFLWCCHALAWGIQKYDQFKETKTWGPTP